MDIIHFVLQNILHINYGLRPGLHGIEITLDNNKWVSYEQAFGETVEETAAKYEEQYKWHLIREKRNTLLAETDWTQINPNFSGKKQYAEYRKQLRQIPQKHSHPDTVNWPVPPA